MLGKTIKHEFGATARIFLPVYAAMLLAAVVTRIFCSFDFRTDAPQSIVTAIMVMVFTAAWVVTLKVILQRFWTNQLGREGYLTNVLPVSAWQHVFAKLLAAAVWTICAAVVSAVSLIVVVTVFYDMQQIFSSLCSAAAHLAGMMEPSGLIGSCVLFAVLIALSALLVLLSVICQCYTAMSIGQMFNRHRVWISIAAFFALSIVCSVALTAIVRLIDVSRAFEEINTAKEYFAVMNTMLGIGVGIEALKTAIMFAAPSLLLKYRLNLQ